MVVFGGDELCSMVLDVGRDAVKAGLSGDDLPRAVFPAIHIAGSEGEQIGWDAVQLRLSNDDYSCALLRYVDN